jgi:hypothetical protein
LLRIRKRPFAAGLVLVTVLLPALPAGAAEQPQGHAFVDQVCDWLASLWGDPAAPSPPDEGDGSKLPVRSKGGEIDPNG